MATTIQITEQLQNELAQKKLFERETYEEVIWDLIEDAKELNEQTKKEIEKAFINNFSESFKYYACFLTLNKEF